ncbi:amino acid synthesis family protein [Leucobacter soli]|uniref:amino acid synthesis family protein n=1 Tax=Leucobacter soli TaxID=2812850 RepID=UPI00361BF9D4
MNNPAEPAARTTDLSTRSSLTDYGDIARAAGLRRIFTQTEEIPREGAPRSAEPSPRRSSGTPGPEPAPTRTCSPRPGASPLLAKLISDRLLDALGGADQVEAFGKAALVGTAGELEHAGALIHTPTSATCCARRSAAPRSSASSTAGPTPANCCACRCGTRPPQRRATTTRRSRRTSPMRRTPARSPSSPQHRPAPAPSPASATGPPIAPSPPRS